MRLYYGNDAAVGREGEPDVRAGIVTCTVGVIALRSTVGRRLVAGCSLSLGVRGRGAAGSKEKEDGLKEIM